MQRIYSLKARKIEAHTLYPGPQSMCEIEEFKNNKEVLCPTLKEARLNPFISSEKEYTTKTRVSYWFLERK